MSTWEEQKERPTENFHLDPTKEIDPVETLVAELGREGALSEVEGRLDENPNDEEARRQAALLINRSEDIARAAARLKSRTQH